MDIVVVESPSKAKTINKYLGSGFKVLASYGHVRDLPSKDGSVRPDDDFAMDWAIDAKAQKHMREITSAVKGAGHLYLATDPDREGEAISWHVQEVLNQKKLLGGVIVKRVVFNEITKSAILDAFSHPRDLDQGLVDAYLARRALDYLVGFTLSPVLWRKLPGSRSAGRVQSVALRLICDRETEIENFEAREFWTVQGAFTTPKGDAFTAQLSQLDGQKLGKFDLPDEAAATRAVAAVEAGSFTVAAVERKQSRRSPAPPFITSTLQQEAARKLGFAARRTMQVAQKLYEGISLGGETVGLITYMRTDGVTMAGEAIAASRGLIGRLYGGQYVPPSPRVYKSKVKNAQEAHEAIRPTDVTRRPEDLQGVLNDEQFKLYQLIWKRTIACQMEAAVLDQVACDIASADGQTVLRATGSVIAFDGFFRVYREGLDDADENGERILPAMNEGEAMVRGGVTPEQHFTQPPPRFTEASLVKKLEELGIGRPSTYASIISVLQERDYVQLDKRRFVPEDRGRLVTAFLDRFFAKYVEDGFTAEMEAKLDDVSGGRIDWKVVLGDFWRDFTAQVDETKDLRVRQVLDAINESLGAHFFRDRGDGKSPRACPTCDTGELSLKIGRFGAFIGCSNYPDCRHTRPLGVANGDDAATADTGPKDLGTDPVTGLGVSLRKGPYGPYVQLGEAAAKEKPKRASLPRGLDAADVDLARALGLLALPREVGVHPESGEMIAAGIGRFGPYIKYGAQYVSLKGDDDVLSIGLNRAVALIADAPKKDPPRNLGNHPRDGKPVTARTGRWGPYAQHGKNRVNLGQDKTLEAVTLEEAVTLLDAKGGGAGAKSKGKSKKTPATNKKAAKLPSAKTPKRKSA